MLYPFYIILLSLVLRHGSALYLNYRGDYCDNQYFSIENQNTRRNTLGLVNGNHRRTFPEYEMICWALGVNTDKFLRPRMPEKEVV